ncbi:hypothetical protein [Enterovibrio nigricans]|uniref:Uncharacterized protein n=1 Tax=Enterovibrio nigricans DSM 22720 TaxID=1121868 RepID=A0A1T4V5T5_9GAMM|nr:hypothetical protein [Enterovibrio nigricans]PKF49890.1 hypothetical protein AT251_15685 [Enterovibrio nigricans]SKA60325.1 hypothetical protein SAMN02745132_03281 [Enterovibrio nigricans DSM 22720]
MTEPQKVSVNTTDILDRFAEVLDQYSYAVSLGFAETPVMSLVHELLDDEPTFDVNAPESKIAFKMVCVMHSNVASQPSPESLPTLMSLCLEHDFDTANALFREYIK